MVLDQQIPIITHILTPKVNHAHVVEYPGLFIIHFKPSLMSRVAQPPRPQCVCIYGTSVQLFTVETTKHQYYFIHFTTEYDTAQIDGRRTLQGIREPCLCWPRTKEDAEGQAICC